MSHACSPLSAGRDSLAVGLPKFESERLSIAGRTLTKRSMRVPTVEQRLENVDGTEFQELLYPWHQWSISASANARLSCAQSILASVFTG